MIITPVFTNNNNKQNKIPLLPQTKNTIWFSVKTNFQIPKNNKPTVFSGVMVTENVLI